MSIVLPLSAIPLSKGHNAYPFSAQRYGSGAETMVNSARHGEPNRGGSSSFWQNQAANSNQGITANGLKGGSSSFYQNQAASSPVPMVGKGTHKSVSGSGYFGPRGWVNTQPVMARSEQSNLNNPDFANEYNPDFMAASNQQRYSDSQMSRGGGVSKTLKDVQALLARLRSKRS